MWALLKASWIRWVLLTILVPVVAWLIRSVIDRVERRRGVTRATRAIRKAADWLPGQRSRKR